MTSDHPVVPVLTISFLITLMFHQSPVVDSLKCYKCIAINCPPSSPSGSEYCDQIDRLVTQYAGKYLSLKSPLLTRCPPPDHHNGWEVLREEAKDCPERNSACVLTRFEVAPSKHLHFQSSTDTNYTTDHLLTYGTITGCDSPAHRKQFRVIGEGVRRDQCVYVRGKESVTTRIKPINNPDSKNDAAVFKNITHDFIFEYCRTNNGTVCGNCDHCNDRDFCINRQATLPKRLIFEDGSAMSSIVAFSALGISLVLIAVVSLAVDDKPGYSPLGRKSKNKKMTRMGITYYEYEFDTTTESQPSTQFPEKFNTTTLRKLN